MHCQANYFSPKQQSDLDIELPAGCTDETYLGTLHHWLKRLLEKEHNYYKATTESVVATTLSAADARNNNKFDLIFYQAGVDILECDRLGRMNLTAAGVAKRNEMVFTFATKLNVPLVITMGGGYPAAAASHRRNEDDDTLSSSSSSSSKQEDEGSWTPILEAHANVYIQAYQHLVAREKESIMAASTTATTI
jgi:hypothetical protein